MSLPSCRRARLAAILVVAFLLLVVWHLHSSAPSPLPGTPPLTSSSHDDLRFRWSAGGRLDAFHSSAATVVGSPPTQTERPTCVVREHSAPYRASRVSSSSSSCSTAALERMCVATQFRSGHDATTMGTSMYPSVVLTLDRTLGGVGNLRGQLLDFLYFALSAGNVSILLPSTLHTRPKAPPMAAHHFFDVPFLIARLRTACPHVSVFSSRSDLPSTSTTYVRHVHVIQPTRSTFSRSTQDISKGNSSVASPCRSWLSLSNSEDGDGIQQQQAALVQQRVREFWLWCNVTLGPHMSTPGLTHVVVPTRRANGVLWDFDLRGRENTLRRVALGNALRVAPAARRVAASILCVLREDGCGRVENQSSQHQRTSVTTFRRRRCGGEADATIADDVDEEEENYGALVAGQGRVLCGCHMRSEDDMRHLASIGNATTQSLAFLAEAAHRNCSVLYVAGGKPHHVERLKRLAEATSDDRREATRIKIIRHKYEIVELLLESITLLPHSAPFSSSTSWHQCLNRRFGGAKYDELREDLLRFRASSSTPWDLRALVDYEVVSQCDYFFGVTTSSFSWNIAVRRHFDYFGPRRADNPSLVEDLDDRAPYAGTRPTPYCVTQRGSMTNRNGTSLGRPLLLSSTDTDQLLPNHRTVPWTYDDGKSVLFLRMAHITHKNLEARAPYGMWP